MTTTLDSKLTSMGGLVDKDSQESLIRACALVHARPDIGDGEMEDELQHLVDELGSPGELRLSARLRLDENKARA